MSRNQNAESGNFFSNLFNDIREYIERCFGVNDIEKRYAREAEMHKRKAKVSALAATQSNSKKN